MVFRVILALVLAGLSLLVFGERLGLPAPIAASGVFLVLVCGGFAVALAATTTRLPLYLGAKTGPAALLALAMGSIPTAMLLPLSLRVDLVEGSIFLAGFAAGAVVFPQLPKPFWRPARDILGLSSLLVAMLLLLAALPGSIPLLQFQAGTGPQAALLVILLPGFAVLLGGAVGVARLTGFLAGTFMLMVVVPLGVEALSTSLLYDGVKAGLRFVLEHKPDEMIMKLRQLADEGERAKLGWAFAAGLALALPFSTFLMQVEKRYARLAASLLTVLVMGSIVILGVLCAQSFQMMLMREIAALPPNLWPPFVFDERISGWITVCGIAPNDAADVVRACKEGVGKAISSAADTGIILDTRLAAPAFAMWRGWPIVFGLLANMVLPFLLLAGLAMLLNHAAIRFSEIVLHGWLLPHALKTMRVSLMRLSVLGMMAGFALWLQNGYNLPRPVLEIGLAATACLCLLAYFMAFLAFIPGWYQRRVAHEAIPAAPAPAKP